MSLWPLHGATYDDEGVVTPMLGHKGLAIQVCNPVTEIILTCCDYTTFLTFEGIVNGEGGVADVTEFG